MEQLLEFATNHTLLVAAAAVTGGLLLFYEYRLAGQGRFAVSPDQAVRLINKGALVLDLRPPEAYAAGHLAGARNLQLADFDTAIQSFKKFRGKPVITYDERGTATAKVIALLRAAEFENVFSLRGGVVAWREEHLPLEKEQQGKMSASVNQAVASVVVYGTARCPYCVRARALLDSKGVSYQDIRLDEQPQYRAEMVRLSNRRTVPQIFINDDHIGGCDELYSLEYAGGLDAALGIA